MAEEMVVKDTELSGHHCNFLRPQNPWQQPLEINQPVNRNNDPSHGTGPKTPHSPRWT